MKITSVTYSRLVSVERFGNVKVDATASLDPTDDPDEAFKELRQWVDLQVLTKKHKIEHTIAVDDDDDDPPFSAPAPQRAQMNGGSISASQIKSGTIIGMTGSGQAMTLDPATGGLLFASSPPNPLLAVPDDQVADLIAAFGPTRIPHQGKREVVFHSTNQAEIIVSDMFDRPIEQRVVSGDLARAFLARVDRDAFHHIEVSGVSGYQPQPQRIHGMSGIVVDQPDTVEAWYDEHRRSGNAWERADRARAGMAPPQGWLQAHHSTDPAIPDRLEFRDFARPRVDRAFKAGYLHEAIDRGLLVFNRNAPGLSFGPGGEDALSIAAPAFYDASDPTDEDDPGDE